MAKNATATTGKYGRPPKRDTEKRSKQLNLRLTLHEEEYLRKAAEEIGVDVSEYVRQRSLSGRVRPRVYHKQTDAASIVALHDLAMQLVPQIEAIQRELARQGNNVHQLTRDYNGGREWSLHHKLQEFDNLPGEIVVTQNQVRETLARIDTTLQEMIAGSVVND